MEIFAYSLALVSRHPAVYIIFLISLCSNSPNENNRTLLGKGSKNGEEEQHQSENKWQKKRTKINLLINKANGFARRSGWEKIESILQFLQ